MLLRCIECSSSTQGSFTSEQSINQVLQAAFNILTYEKVKTIDYLMISSMNVFQTNQPHLLGASHFSPDDIYLKLKKLKAALPKDVNGVLYVKGPDKAGL